MISRWQIIILFNARWEDGCDYAQQTIRLVARKNSVVAVPLAHQRSIWQAFLQWRQGTIFVPYHNAQVFTPIAFLPFRSHALMRHANNWLNALVVKLLLKQQCHYTTTQNSKQMLWFFEPENIAVWVRMFAQWQSLYDCVDYWPGFQGKIQRMHEWLVRHATWMVVNSRALFETVVPQRSDVVQVPLGFAYEEYSLKASKQRPHRDVLVALQQLKAVHKSGKKIFGFIGQIGNRFDFPWLIQLMRAFPQHVFVFVGAIWSWKEIDDSGVSSYLRILKSQPNYLHLPAVAKQQVPLFVQLFDFGLIPYNTHQVFNRNCHPMKLYEYWWFGKPVLATAIYELNRYTQNIFSSDDATSVIKWTRQRLNKHTVAEQQKKHARQSAIEHSWEAKLSAISQVVCPEYVHQP